MIPLKRIVSLHYETTIEVHDMTLSKLFKTYIIGTDYSSVELSWIVLAANLLMRNQDAFAPLR